MADSIAARIAVIIHAQGARAAAADITGVASATKAQGDASVLAGKKTAAGSSASSGALSKLGGVAGLAKGGMAAAALAALALGAASIKAFEGAAGSTIKLQRVTGQSTESASAWVEEAKLRGIGADQLQAGFGRLGKAMYQAKNGSKTAQDALKGLGVSMSTIKSGNFDAVLNSVADRMHGMKNAGDRTALSTQVFGRKMGLTLLPILMQGKKGIDDFKKASDAAGTTLKDTKSLKEHAKQMRDLNRTFDGVKISIGAVLLPLMNQAVKAFQSVMKSIRPAIPGIKAFGKAFVIPMAKAFLGSMVIGLRLVAGVIAVVMNLVHGRWGAAWKAAKNAVSGFAKAAVKLFLLVTGPVRALGKLIWSAIGGGMTQAWNFVSKIGGQILAFFTSLPAKLAAGAKGMWNFFSDGFKDVVNFVIGNINTLLTILRGIHIKVPKILGVGGGTISLPVPNNIAPLEHGGTVSRAGRVLVGEAGAEILDLPTGARVTPLSGASLAGGEIVAHIHVHLDGKQVAKSVRRVALADLAAQS